MRRREFITGAAATAVLALDRRKARAQSPATIKRPLIAIVDLQESTAEHSTMDVFLAAMSELGYVDGKTATIVQRYAAGNTPALPGIATDLARLKPDLVVCDTASPIKAAEAAMPRTPIVGITMSYPVEQGLIASFAHPGGNITGVAAAVEELDTKLLELGLRAVPAAKTVGLLMNPSASLSDIERRAYEKAARARGLVFHAAAADAPEKIDGAVAALAAAGVQLIVAQENGLLFTENSRIGALTIAHRIPVISTQTIKQIGYLLTYGINALENYRRAAGFVDKILKGAEPAELPVEFPSKLLMSINLKTAQALGLVVPQELLNIADQVIE